MMNRIQARHTGIIAVGAGLLGALIYALMINVTLAHLETISGIVPFDMRPFGYSPTEAATLLDALGEDGRAYYLSHQIPLDTLYPAMLAVTLTATICWLGQGLPNSNLVRAGVVLSIGSALFDYVENICVIAMIWNWREVPDLLVYAASTATIAKSVLTTIAVLLTLLLGVIWARLRKSGFRPNP